MSAPFDHAATVELALAHYRQPHRFYHDVAHVQEMMALSRALFLDLHRLGSPWSDFDRHARAIEREFRVLHASPEKFRTAGGNFYRGMLRFLKRACH